MFYRARTTSVFKPRVSSKFQRSSLPIQQKIYRPLSMPAKTPSQKISKFFDFEQALESWDTFYAEMKNLIKGVIKIYYFPSFPLLLLLLFPSFSTLSHSSLLINFFYFCLEKVS